MPLNGAEKILFETGALMLTVAYYKALNESRKAGNKDIILPPKMLYNFNYARYTTPEYKGSIHHYYNSNQKLLSEEPGLLYSFYRIKIETLGRDMFEGSWAKNLLEPIDYSGHIQNIGSYSGYLCL